MVGASSFWAKESCIAPFLWRKNVGIAARFPKKYRYVLRLNQNNFQGFARFAATQLRFASMLECTGGDYGNLGEVRQWKALSRYRERTNDSTFMVYRLTTATTTAILTLTHCSRKTRD
jgi:hypothetical protein